MSIFTTQKSRRVAQVTEEKLIEMIVHSLGRACPPFPAGPGGDCAIIPQTEKAKYRVSTIDSVILGRHFDSSCSGKLAGRKLVERNLSDLAAAGAKPKDALLSLFIGPDVDVRWLKEFAQAVGQSALRAGLNINGGDVCRIQAGQFSATLSVQGFSQHILTRTTCQLGDRLFVTGELGGSLLGHHLHFRARVAEGLWLANQKAVTACTDLSDGLLKDLPSLIGKKWDALVDLEKLPLRLAAHKMAKKDGQSALEHALRDGEDYELLFCVKAKDAPSLARKFKREFPQTRLTEIGFIKAGKGLARSMRNHQPLSGKGFGHFA